MQDSSTTGVADKRCHFVATVIGDARDFYTYTNSDAAGAERQADFQYEVENRSVLNDFR